MPERRFAPAVRYALSIDGVHAGWPLSFQGGEAIGDVVEIADGSDLVVRKHLGGVHFSDLDLLCGPDVTAALLEWISATLSHDVVTKNGAVSAVDVNANEVWRLEFSNALVSRVTLPKLDGASKDPAAFGLTLTPELTRRLVGSGAKLKTPAAKSQKAWLASNFRLTIDGLDTKLVTKIEPPAVGISSAEQSTGEHRTHAGGPTRIDVANMFVVLAAAGADTWWAWHEDFVVDGNNGPGKEREGTLELLAADGSVQLQVVLRGLGIVSAGHPQSAGPTDTVPMVRAELYCEEISLAVPA